jgi:DNA-directed RNA polymerase specialized sigma24 family protein
LQDLKRALAKLPDEQQSALLLAGMEGTRHDEKLLPFSACR